MAVSLLNRRLQNGGMHKRRLCAICSRCLVNFLKDPDIYQKLRHSAVHVIRLN